MSKILYADMEISDKIKRALEKMNITEPSDIQEKTIPLMMQNVDLIAQSQTGSGKTLAFAIPIIEKINVDSKKNQALILCPTRELAQQIAKVFEDLLEEYKNIKSVCLYGGQSITVQLDKLKNGAQILIGTPGRILDHINRRSINLMSLNTVVLDEADEMLNMGFKEDIEAILGFTNDFKQTTMFSATMPKEILSIAENFLNDYQTVKVSKSLGVKNISQEYIEVHKDDKMDALIQLLFKEYLILV
jgi:ATP-dependent RNA helicase DeaD